MSKSEKFNPQNLNKKIESTKPSDATIKAQDQTREKVASLIENKERIQKYQFHNSPSGRNLEVSLDRRWPSMLPSFSTRLLIEHMNIRANESVLDLGAGTGVVGIAAKLLGAGAVTALEISPFAQEEIPKNCEANNQPDIKIVIGNLFSPLSGQRFDHIIINPPSTPSLPEHELPPTCNSGPEGRDIHDTVQLLAMYYLKGNGRLTLVHGSLSNLDLSITNLRRLGYQVETEGPFEYEFRDWYPIDHIFKLAKQNKARYSTNDGKYYEQRYIITATMEQEKTTKVMAYLDRMGINYRMLPHRQEAKTCELAAEERGVPLDEMIKSILLRDKKGRRVLACLTGEANLDPKKVVQYLEGYARLSFASAEEISEILGYKMGSVAPIDLKTQIPVVLDTTIKSKDKVNISSGDPRLGLELKTEDFIKCVPNAIFGEIKKDSE